MNRQEFNERIQEDYEQFKASILELPKEAIFNKGFEIGFKSFISDYLQNDEVTVDDKTIENLNKIEGSVIDNLFEIYRSSDTYYTYEDLCKEIIEIFNDNFFNDEELE